MGTTAAPWGPDTHEKDRRGRVGVLGRFQGEPLVWVGRGRGHMEEVRGYRCRWGPMTGELG